MFSQFKKKIRKHFHEVIKLKTSPHSIALGFAIGTFISILPTPGFNIILGLLVVLIYEKVNKFSLFAGILFWNPLTAPPIYWLSYKIGDLLLGSIPTVTYELSLWNQIYNFSRRFLVGIFILALTISTIMYFLMRLLVIAYRKSRKEPV